jgi:hypothetical protein
MDEREWLRSDDPAAMLAFLRGHEANLAEGIGGGRYVLSERKQRLFVVAAMRYLIGRGDPPPTVHQLAALSELERFADDGNEDGLYEAWRDTNLPRPRIALGTNAAARMHADMMARYTMPDMKSRGANLLREIIANPFAPHPLASWSPPPSLSGIGLEMRRLAEAAYKGDLSAYGPLSDLLEEAGCPEGELLRHLRGQETCPTCAGSRRTIDGKRAMDLINWEGSSNVTAAVIEAIKAGIMASKPCPDCQATGWVALRSPHVRGCWAVSSLLQKE